jgi:type II secretory pathway component PulF
MNISRAIFFIILQILSFIVIHGGTIRIHKQFFVPQKVNFDWGITVEMAFWLFTVISVAVTVLSEFVFKSRQFTFLLIGFLVFGAFHIQHITDRPYRTLLLLVSAFMGLMMPFLVMQNRVKNAPFRDKQKQAKSVSKVIRF